MNVEKNLCAPRFAMGCLRPGGVLVGKRTLGRTGHDIGGVAATGTADGQGPARGIAWAGPGRRTPGGGGERGIVLLSDDAGVSWRQAKVPVSVSLTAVQFVDAEQGWAVGHLGVVLHTQDGGGNLAKATRR